VRPPIYDADIGFAGVGARVKLAGWARLLLWDFERGSLPWDIVCLLMALFMLLVQPAWLGDPMARLP